MRRFTIAAAVLSLAGAAFLTPASASPVATLPGPASERIEMGNTSGIGSLYIYGAVRRDKKGYKVYATGASVTVKDKRSGQTYVVGTLGGGGSFSCTVPSGTSVDIILNFDGRQFWIQSWTVPNKGGSKSIRNPELH